MDETVDRDAAAAFEEKLKTLETVDVTLKIPKPLYDFLSAVVSFTKRDTTAEQILVNVAEDNIINVLEGARIEEVLGGFEGKQLIKAYKLDEIDC